MVRLLSQRQLAGVRRDRDQSVNIADSQIHAVARLEAEDLEINVDRLHPRQVRPATLGKVRVVAQDQLKRLLHVDGFVLSTTWLSIGVSHFRLLLRVGGGQRVVWVAAHAARASLVPRVSPSFSPLRWVLLGKTAFFRPSARKGLRSTSDGEKQSFMTSVVGLASQN